MTYLSLIKAFTELGSSAPSHEAAELICALTGKSREWCILNKDEELPKSVDDALQKRISGIPLQYITGEAWFFGNRFKVSPDCLIPQPDTEHLVMLALKYVNNSSDILDLCTGSGCIAISILKENTTAKAQAVDISIAALDIAKTNAELHGVTDRIQFLHTDVLNTDLQTLCAEAGIIVSNPPYINTDVIPTLSAEVQHEPTIALDGGADGMIFYRHFLGELAKYMRPDAVMLLEIGYDQASRIDELCQKHNLTCQFHKDFGGNIRVAEIRHNI